MRLLLVEDDVMVGAGIQLGLRQDDFVVDWVEDGAAAEKALRSASYAVVVLDLGLPRKHSLAILEELHWRKVSIPVVAIDAHGTAAPHTVSSAQASGTAVRALDLDELAERIRAAVRWCHDRAGREGAIFALPFSWH